METPDGAIPVTLDLKAEGAKLTGTVSTGGRDFPIESGSVEGNTIKLTIKRERQGGAAVYQITGKAEGKTMKGTTVADLAGEKMTQEWEAKKQ